MPRIKQPAGLPLGPDWQLRALIARNQYGNHVTAEVERVLQDFYNELSDRLASGIDFTDWQQTRLEQLMRWANARYTEVATTARAQTTNSLVAGGQAESAGMLAQSNQLRGLMGVPARSQLIQIARYTDIVRTADIGGVGFGDWWQQHARRALGRMKNTVTTGYLEGIGPRGVAARVLEVLGPQDVTFTKMVVRTTMTAVSSHAADMEHNEMQDVLGLVRFEAILDARTSFVCRKWDGKEFRIGDKKMPKPPLHPNCRSALVGVPDWAKLGLSSEMGRRVSYDQWFRKQEPQLQNEVLGYRRAELYRAQKLTLAQMVRSDGTTITVKQLEAKLAREARKAA